MEEGLAFSELTVADLADYLHEDEAEPLLSSILSAGKHYVLNYTGMTAEEAETHADLVVAVLAICGDLWDKRRASVESCQYVNPVVDQILGSYGGNLLGPCDE